MCIRDSTAPQQRVNVGGQPQQPAARTAAPPQFFTPPPKTAPGQPTFAPTSTVPQPSTVPAYMQQEMPQSSQQAFQALVNLSLIHISEPTRLLSISYAVFCLKKKKKIKPIK
eukprot:TRINITY_DN2101_c0_g1_i1.p2 TRINITY_DN2101_c0_g1~~TRINITY_DN2101_c0_g1_i1.p2  ORF type:complete len:112 (+),score=38.13 TRINITY_DN2101_c0_g1_i1:114-449(+)